MRAAMMGRSVVLRAATSQSKQTAFLSRCVGNVVCSLWRLMRSDPKETQASIPDPPRGWDRLAWLGPGFLWMVSAAGSGELLFTPRIAALYGYSLLWALLAAVALKWFINREIGRFAVCTRKNVLEGFA